MRKGLWLAGAVVLVLVGVVALLPFAASTQIVRDRIALELSAWSGYRVELGRDPQIDIWPFFKAELYDVRFSSWSDQTRTPVLVIERIDAALSAFEALFGHVVFSSATLARPTLRLSRRADGGLAAAYPEGGRLAHSIAAARALVTANPDKPDRSALPGDPFGRVEFVDGRVVTTEAGADVEVASSLGGSLDWIALDRSARINAKGIWRGESVTVNLSAQQPLILLGGGTSNVSVKVEAAPAGLAFDGRANVGMQPYVEGELSVTTPSLRRMLEWSGQESAAGAAVGSVAVTAAVSGDARRLRFEETEIVFDGNPGTGVLEVSLAGKVPSISGTLAFESINLRSFLSVFTPSGDRSGMSIDTVFADQAAMDLRLSAARASAGAITMTDTAATIQVKEGIAAFDISDATAFGGMIQAGLRFDRRPEGNQAEFRFKATDVDGVAVASALGWTWMVPAARGTITANLKAPVGNWTELVAGAGGAINVGFGQGSIAGFDMAAFIARTKTGGFFPLAEIAKGTLPIEGFDVAATVTGGVARIDKAEVRTPDKVVRVTGLVPFSDGGLALTGELLGRATTDAATSWSSELGFFIGGTWRSPYATAILPDPAFQ